MSWSSSFQQHIDCEGGSVQDTRCQLSPGPRELFWWNYPKVLVRSRNNPCIHDMQQLWNNAGIDLVCPGFVGTHMQFPLFARILLAIHHVECRSTHDFASDIATLALGFSAFWAYSFRDLQTARSIKGGAFTPGTRLGGAPPPGAPSHVEEDIPVAHSGPVRSWLSMCWLVCGRFAAGHIGFRQSVSWIRLIYWNCRQQGGLETSCWS